MSKNQTNFRPGDLIVLYDTRYIVVDASDNEIEYTIHLGGWGYFKESFIKKEIQNENAKHYREVKHERHQ